MNKHHKVSFSYYFIFDRIICVLVTFWERGHFVMLMIKSLHLINLHFWTYLLSSAANLRYLRANTKRPFRWLLLRSGSSFRLKGFHPFLDIYLQSVAADPGRPLFFSCLMIFLVEFPLLYIAFSITFFLKCPRNFETPCRVSVV